MHSILTSKCLQIYYNINYSKKEIFDNFALEDTHCTKVEYTPYMYTYLQKGCHRRIEKHGLLHVD